MLKRLLFLAILLFLASSARAQCPPGAYGPGCSSGSGFPVTSSQSVGNGGSINVTPGTSGSIAGVQTAAPPLGFYLVNKCPTSNTPTCFYTFSNFQLDVTCSWTNASTTVTCTDAPFTSSALNVGMQVMGYNSCNAFQSATNGGQITAASVVTIATFVSTTQVTLSATPANSSTAGACLVFGNPDDTAATAIDAAFASLTTAPTCPKLFLAGAYYGFALPHFYAQPAACNILPTIYQASPTGNTFYGAGFEIEGRGTGNTIIWLLPNFGSSSACIHGLNGASCFVVQIEGRWKDFMLSGGNNGTATSLGSTATYLVYVQGPASLDNFTCTNFGNNNLFVSGLGADFWYQFYQVNNSGCGGTGLTVASGSAGTAFKMRIENSPGAALNIAGPAVNAQSYSLSCYDCGFYNGLFALGSNLNIYNQGGSLLLYHSNVTPSSDSTAGLIGYQCVTAGCLLTAHDTLFSYGIGSTTNGSIKCTAACTNYLETTTLQATSGGNTYLDVAGSSLYDLGGNTGFASGGGASVTGNVYGSPSITGVQLVTGNVVLTSGWGTGATASAFAGSSGSEVWTTTIGTAPSATAVTTVTFPVPFLPGSKVGCSATLSNGTSTAILQAQCVATPTTATITYIGTLVSGTVITRLTASN
jgi:hypothetical protein